MGTLPLGSVPICFCRVASAARRAASNSHHDRSLPGRRPTDRRIERRGGWMGDVDSEELAEGQGKVAAALRQIKLPEALLIAAGRDRNLLASRGSSIIGVARDRSNKHLVDRFSALATGGSETARVMHVIAVGEPGSLQTPPGLAAECRLDRRHCPAAHFPVSRVRRKIADGSLLAMKSRQTDGLPP
jgi:hypothetical protein